MREIWTLLCCYSLLLTSSFSFLSSDLLPLELCYISSFFFSSSFDSLHFALFDVGLEEATLLVFEKNKKMKLGSFSVMVVFLLLLPLASPLSDEGSSLSVDWCKCVCLWVIFLCVGSWPSNHNDSSECSGIMFHYTQCFHHFYKISFLSEIAEWNFNLYFYFIVLF